MPVSVITHLECVTPDNTTDPVGSHFPQHSQHGNVGLACSSGRTHKHVLVAAGQEYNAVLVAAAAAVAAASSGVALAAAAATALPAGQRSG